MTRCVAQMIKICMVAGDHSGDLHAAALARSIKQLNADARITALGGKHLMASADSFSENLVDINAFGFAAAAQQYLKLKQIFKDSIINAWDRQRPDKVVLVDYYGFNIHVAEEAKRRGIPVYYYISPQVWATRPGRIKRLARCVKKMLVILPFEEKLYRQAGVDAVFVGHPLIDIVPEPLPHEAGDTAVIGLFPGSRKTAINAHCAILEKAANIIRKEFPAECRFFGLRGHEADYPVSLPVIFDSDYTEHRKLDLALTVSGTVCLEHALLGIPMTVMYKLSAFNYLLARMLVRIPYITMANILLDKPLVPELIQGMATPEKIASNALQLLRNRDAFQSMRRQLLSIRKMLGAPGVSARVAGIILKE